MKRFKSPGRRGRSEPLGAFDRILTKGKFSFDAFNKARATLSPDQIRLAHAWVCTKSERIRYFPCFGKLSYEDLLRGPLLDELDLFSELIWAANVLSAHHDIISSVRALSIELEEAILSSSPDRATALAQKIDETVGGSIWNLEFWLILNERFGIPLPHEVSALTSGTLIPTKVVLNLLTLRQQLTYDRYTEFVGRVVSVTPRNGDTIWHSTFRNYVVHKCLRNLPGSTREQANLLRFSYNSNIVDLYELCITLISKLIFEHQSILPPAKIKSVLTLLAPIPDFRLDAMRVLTDSQYTPRSYKIASSHASEQLYRGEYTAAMKTAELEIIQLSRDPNHLITICEAALRSKSSGPALAGINRDLVDCLISTWKCDESPVSIDSKFKLISIKYWNLSLVKVIHSYFQRITTVEDTSGVNRLNGIGFIFSEFKAPRHVRANINARFRGELFAKFAPTHPLALTLEYNRGGIIDQKERDFHLNVEKLSASYIKLSQIRTDFLSRNTDHLVQKAYALLDDPAADPQVRLLTLKYLSAHLEKVGDLDGLLALTCRLCSQPALLRFNIPFKFLTDSINREKNWLHVTTTISGPIVLYLAKNLGFDVESETICWAYEDFLEKSNVRSPSQLSADKFRHAELVYFWRYICVPHVIEDWDGVRTAEELEQIRIELCRLLMAIDKENLALYEAEIRYWAKKNKLERGMRDVDSMRVYVDVGAYRAWAVGTYENTYADLLRLRGAGWSALTLARVTSVASGETKPVSAVVFDQTTPANSFLSELVGDLFARFLLDPIFGLECYLGGRIRHGRVTRALRGVVQAASIAMLYRLGKNEYIRDSRWDEAGLAEGVAEQFWQVVEKFSRDFDAAISRLIRRIYVKTAERPEGGIVAQIQSDDLLSIALKSDKASTIGEFVDTAVEVFWQVVERSLGELRGAIEKDVKREFRSTFAQLSNGLRSIVHTDSGFGADTLVERLVGAAQSAQTQVIAALDGVIDWLRVSDTTKDIKRTLTEIVEVQLYIAGQIHPDIQINPHLQIQDEMIVGHRVAAWDQIFEDLVINIIQHSGKEIVKDEKVEVHVSIVPNGAQWHVTVRNEVSPSVYRDKLVRDRVAELSNVLTQARLPRIVTDQGGTGLLRIAHAIRSPSGENNFRSIGFVEPSHFEVRFEVGNE
jgi:hypothetical protein